MNIKDLQPNSYRVISEPKLNINNLPKDSYKVVSGEVPSPYMERPAQPSGFENTLNRINEFNPIYQIPKMAIEGGLKLGEGLGKTLLSKTPSEAGKNAISAMAGGVQGTLAVQFGLFESATNLPGIKSLKNFLWGTEKGSLPEFIGDKISDFKLLQDIVSKNPNLPEITGDLTTIVLGLYGKKKSASPEFKNAVSNVKSKVITPIVKNIETKLQKYKIEKENVKFNEFKSEIRNEVTELLSKTKGIITKTQLGQKKKTNYAEIISEPEIFKGLKVENKKINPNEAITTIDKRINDLMEVKNQMLPFADKYVKNPTREQLRIGAYKNIEGKYLPAQETALKRAIDKQVNVLPDNFPVSQMDNIRAKARADSMNTQGLPLDNEFTAIMKSARDIVFKSTDNLPIETRGEFAKANTYIKDMINTREFLDKTLRGQVVSGGRLNSLVGRITGGIIGSTGGFLTGLVGQEIGAQIADIITNNQLGSAVKMGMIKNLTDNPQVLKQVREVLRNIEKYQQPLLQRGQTTREFIDNPQPRTVINNQNVITPPLRLPNEVQFSRNRSQNKPIETTKTTVSKNPISKTISQSNINVNKDILKLKNADIVKKLVKNIPKPGSVEQIVEKTEGWKYPGFRQVFDEAMSSKNVELVKKLLPDVPIAYKEEFTKEISNIIK